MKYKIYIAFALFVALNSSATSFAQTDAQDVDAGKLKFLSCKSLDNDPITSSKEFEGWVKNIFNLYLTNTKKNASRNNVAAPIEINEKFVLKGACLENIKLYIGPGVAGIHGEVCNLDLNEFISALASIGIHLSSGSVFSDKKLPIKISNSIIASSKDDTKKLYRSYLIVEGGFDLGTMEIRLIKNKYSFFCER